MALEYEASTALSQFSFTQFKTVMDIADIDEPTYALILRAIFDTIDTQHEIVIDDLGVITNDLIYAIYRHAKFVFEVQKNKLDIISKTADSSGNRTTFIVEVPTEVRSVYRMYSPSGPAFL